MKLMDVGMLNKMMEPNTAFAMMIAEVGQADLTEMEELIIAVEEQICYPRNISVMQLFSIWANMEPVHA
tara:strand:- start:71 stop:277 length:207 start_codon:yes stop_codon:yes gene_type:complete